jgi:hypothetical protein
MMLKITLGPPQDAPLLLQHDNINGVLLDMSICCAQGDICGGLFDDFKY